MQLIAEQRAEGFIYAHRASPFKDLEVFRLQKHLVKLAPEVPGVYFLVGRSAQSGLRKIYVGMSESKKTGIKGRLREHKNDSKKEFFGEIFAFPIPDPVFCKSVEAEFIQELIEAEEQGFLELANDEPEKNSLGGFQPTVKPFCEEIKSALSILKGVNIFVDEGAAPSESKDGKSSSSLSLNDLIDAKLLDPKEKLLPRAGEDQASIDEDGSILVNGVPYSSLSTAAGAANVAAGGHESVNGWVFWKVERDGKLISLRDLSAELK